MYVESKKSIPSIFKRRKRSRSLKSYKVPITLLSDRTYLGLHVAEMYNSYADSYGSANLSKSSMYINKLHLQPKIPTKKTQTGEASIKVTTTLIHQRPKPKQPIDR